MFEQVLDAQTIKLQTLEEVKIETISVDAKLLKLTPLSDEIGLPKQPQRNSILLPIKRFSSSEDSVVTKMKRTIQVQYK